VSTLELVLADAEGSIPEIGTILDDKYRIDGKLGKGGMAVVLAATHLQLEQRVAIKLLLPECAGNPELAARFVKEGRSATKIRSEHVVRVLDVGDSEGRKYLVMEYLDGRDLDALLAQSGPIPSKLAVDYLLQACEAIAEAHVHGIVHRDLKPANLFLTHRADGSACIKVLDFGISKIVSPSRPGVVAPETSPLLVMGSPHYMSPEQMQSSRDVDARSDLWSLGAILHELIAGKPPFQGNTITALCAAIMIEPPPPLTSLHGEVPPELASVVLRCLEKDPAQRFVNVAALAHALAPLGSEAAIVSAACIERVLEGASDTVSGIQVMLPDLAARTAARKQGARRPRRRVASAVGVLALIAIGSGVGWIFMHRDGADRETEPQPVAALSQAPVAFPPAAPPPPTQATKTPPAGPQASPHRQATMAPSIPAPVPRTAVEVPEDPAHAAAAAVPAPAPDLAAPVSNGEASTDNPY
jgi:hypothetical protein